MLLASMQAIHSEIVIVAVGRDVCHPALATKAAFHRLGAKAAPRRLGTKAAFHRLGAKAAPRRLDAKAASRRLGGTHIVL